MPKRYAGNPKYSVNDIKIGTIVQGKYGVHPVKGFVIKITYDPNYDEEVFQVQCGEGGEGASYPWLRLYEIEEIIE